MPKSTKTLKDFSGGLVTETSPRDLKDNQLVASRGVSIRYPGLVKSLGRFKGDLVTDITATGNALEGGTTPLNFTAGASFKVFSTDTKKDNTVSSESYIAYVDKATGKLWVHDATNKAWEELKPYDTNARVWGNGAVQGIYGQIASSMTSNEALDAVYYIADGGLRVCDPNFSNGTSEGPTNMVHKGTWAAATSYVVDDVVINSNKEYICIVANTSTSTFADDLGAGEWKLLNDQKASTMLLSQIKREYFGGLLSVDDWHCHPARCVPLSPYVASVNTGSISQGLFINSSTAAKAVDFGQIGFTLNLVRNKGDGTLLMRGRKFYASLTYDGTQESTPVEIGTCTLANIQSLAPAPTTSGLGYETEIAKKAEYGDVNIHLKHKVNDQESDSAFVASDVKKNWDEIGTINIVDDRGQTQTLGYTGFATGTSGNQNLYTGTQDGGSSNTTMTDSGASFVVDSLIGMYIKNTTDGTYALITDNTATTVTHASITNMWVDTDAYRIEGVTLTGVSGWVNTGKCDVDYTVQDGSIIITDGGGDYSTGSPPVVTFSAPPSGTTATGDAITTGTSPSISVTGIQITDHGSGYTNGPPTITISGGSATAECNVQSDLTLETTCINHSGTWLPGDASTGNAVEFDPPGEIEKDDENLAFRLTCTVEPKSQVAGREQIFDWNRGGNRVTGINIYTNKYSDDAGTLPETEDFAYVGTFDLESGWVKEDGTHNGWTADSSETTQQNSTMDYVGKMFSTNFQNRTGMFPDTWYTGMRYQTAVVINRRVYAGNVFMKETGKSTYKNYPDRIVKSLPNQFDNFNDYDILDVTVDDGDEIMALETFGGQLLQFKKNSLYVIDVTSEPEFMKATFQYRGIPNRFCTVKTDFGLAFANKYGAFLYNGEIVTELSTNIIDTSWDTLYTDGITVGFNPETKQIFFINTAAADNVFLVYDMISRSWTEGKGTSSIPQFLKGKPFSYAGKTYLPTYSNTGGYGIYGAFWLEDRGTGANGTLTNNWDFTTKEFDLEHPSQIKVLSKLYITYRNGDQAANIDVIILYNDGTGDTSYEVGSIPDGDTADEWKTETFDITPKIKCKTFKVNISTSSATVTSGEFEINDITIVYREKSVK